MNNVNALWWLLLPLIALPIWWHRQRRHSLKIHTLATAQFLAASAPQRRPVWRWRDWILLLLRCLILLIMLAILAGWFLSSRGDTVFLGRGLDPEWVKQELQASGMQRAQQREFCSVAECEIHTTNVLFWLEQQQSLWRPHAKILILARPEQLTMGGQAPQIAHAVQIRIAPAQSSSLLKKTVVQIAIKSERLPAWRRLFASFEMAAQADQEFVLSDKVTSNTSLAIWDLAAPADPDWRAPLTWIISDKSSTAERITNNQDTELESPLLQSLQIRASYVKEAKLAKAAEQKNGQPPAQIWQMSLQKEDPLQNIDAAKRLFEAWQSVRPQAQRIAMQTQDLAASKVPDRLPNLESESPWQQILLTCLVLLFVLERGFAHARRV